MKVRITARKYGQIICHTVAAALAARLVENLSGMGFEILSVEA